MKISTQKKENRTLSKSIKFIVFARNTVKLAGYFSSFCCIVERNNEIDLSRNRFMRLALINSSMRLLIKDIHCVLVYTFTNECVTLTSKKLAKLM